MIFPEIGHPSRKICVVDLIRSGQQPYKDHERFYRVTVRYYDHTGKLREDTGEWITMLMQDALSACGGDRYARPGERKTHTLDEYAKSYVESIEYVGPHTVEVMIREPYID